MIIGLSVAAASTLPRVVVIVPFWVEPVLMVLGMFVGVIGD